MLRGSSRTRPADVVCFVWYLDLKFWGSWAGHPRYQSDVLHDMKGFHDCTWRQIRRANLLPNIIFSKIRTN